MCHMRVVIVPGIWELGTAIGVSFDLLNEDSIGNLREKRSNT